MKALLALAAIAVAVIDLRPRRPAPLPATDDSEVVGMPTTVTTWPCPHCGAADRFQWHACTRPLDQGNATTLGPGWWVEFAPTSRN